MMNKRKMNSVKRIAFAATEYNRKALIEWCYYNQDVLKAHELIASGTMADILQGTIGMPVTRLSQGTMPAHQQLASMIAGQHVDMLVFFWDPAQTLTADNGTQHLYDTAVKNNVIIAPNVVTADFILSSGLLTAEHLVPVAADPAYNRQFSNGNPLHVRSKINNIH